jgi:RNA polymerase sigma-70 factor (ECF subfamily)
MGELGAAVQKDGEQRVIAHTGAGAASSDADLVLRALEGSAWAEAALCRAYSRPLLAMLTRLIGNRADADEIAQDAFVVALETLKRLREPAAFRGWLFRIATNLARRRMRRRKLERFLGVAPAAEDVDLEVFASTSVEPEVRAELALVEERLARLPIDVRLAWSLRFVEGYELSEVAELCACSLATVKRRIERASKKLDAHVALDRSRS